MSDSKDVVQQQKEITHAVQPQAQYINPNHLIDTMVNGMLASSLAQFSKSDKKLNMQTIANFLILMSMSELKLGIMSIINEIKKFVLSLPSNLHHFLFVYLREGGVWSIIKMWVLSKIFFWRKQEVKKTTITPLIENKMEDIKEDNPILINFELTSETIKSFTHYILKNAKYNILPVYDIVCKSLIENKVQKKLENINFNIKIDEDFISCKLKNELIINLDQNMNSDGELLSKNIEQLYGLSNDELNRYIKGDKNISIFLKMIKDDKLREYILKEAKEILNECEMIYDGVSQYEKTNPAIKNYVKVYKKGMILSNILFKYKSNTETIDIFSHLYGSYSDKNIVLFAILHGNLYKKINFCSPYELLYICIFNNIAIIGPINYTFINNIITLSATSLQIFKIDNAVFIGDIIMQPSYNRGNTTTLTSNNICLKSIFKTYEEFSTTSFTNNTFDFKNIDTDIKTDTIKVTKISLELNSDTIPKDNIFEKFYNYFTNNIVVPVKQIDEIETKNIDIYQIVIKRHKRDIWVPNPAYLKWKEENNFEDKKEDKKEDNTEDKKDNKKDKKNSKKDKGIKDDTKDDHDDIIDHYDYGHFPKHRQFGGFNNYQYNYAPPKEIMKTEYELEMKKNKINSTSKSIHTLYLRKKQKEKLISSLSKYKDDKNLYTTLEIPHKLGCLLYGLPGTGKSTTIKVVGTFLGKDIYYIDLGCITKNSELKMIFDFIHNNCNNGIIVFEDIDAMSHIVKNRNLDESKYNLSNLMKTENDELSLSYFLNLLDGTLTSSELVFIMTTNNKHVLDPAIYRKGRVDIDIELQLCDHYQISEIYKSVKQKEIDKDVLKKIQENKYSPADILFHLVHNMYSDIGDDELFSEFY